MAASGIKISDKKTLDLYNPGPKDAFWEEFFKQVNEAADASEILKLFKGKCSRESVLYQINLEKFFNAVMENRNLGEQNKNNVIKEFFISYAVNWALYQNCSMKTVLESIQEIPLVHILTKYLAILKDNKFTKAEVEKFFNEYISASTRLYLNNPEDKKIECQKCSAALTNVGLLDESLVIKSAAPVVAARAIAEPAVVPVSKFVIDVPVAGQIPPASSTAAAKKPETVGAARAVVTVAGGAASGINSKDKKNPAEIQRLNELLAKLGSIDIKSLINKEAKSLLVTLAQRNDKDIDNKMLQQLLTTLILGRIEPEQILELIADLNKFDKFFDTDIFDAFCLTMSNSAFPQETICVIKNFFEFVKAYRKVDATNIKERFKVIAEYLDKPAEFREGTGVPIDKIRKIRIEAVKNLILALNNGVAIDDHSPDFKVMQVLSQTGKNCSEIIRELKSSADTNTASAATVAGIAAAESLDKQRGESASTESAAAEVLPVAAASAVAAEKAVKDCDAGSSISELHETFEGLKNPEALSEFARRFKTIEAIEEIISKLPQVDPETFPSLDASCKNTAALSEAVQKSPSFDTFILKEDGKPVIDKESDPSIELDDIPVKIRVIAEPTEDSPIHFIGDLHGRLSDLENVLSESKFFENNSRLVFGGDYVDRGEESIEILIAVLALKAKYPERVTLLKGNHDERKFLYGFLQTGGIRQWLEKLTSDTARIDKIMKKINLHGFHNAVFSGKSAFSHAPFPVEASIFECLKSLGIRWNDPWDDRGASRFVSTGEFIDNAAAMGIKKVFNGHISGKTRPEYPDFVANDFDMHIAHNSSYYTTRNNDLFTFLTIYPDRIERHTANLSKEFDGAIIYDWQPVAIAPTNAIGLAVETAADVTAPSSAAAIQTTGHSSSAATQALSAVITAIAVGSDETANDYDTGSRVGNGLEKGKPGYNKNHKFYFVTQKTRDAESGNIIKELTIFEGEEDSETIDSAKDSGAFCCFVRKVPIVYKNEKGESSISSGHYGVIHYDKEVISSVLEISYEVFKELQNLNYRDFPKKFAELQRDGKISINPFVETAAPAAVAAEPAVPASGANTKPEIVPVPDSRIYLTTEMERAPSDVPVSDTSATAAAPVTSTPSAAAMPDPAEAQNRLAAEKAAAQKLEDDIANLKNVVLTLKFDKKIWGKNDATNSKVMEIRKFLKDYLERNNGYEIVSFAENDNLNEITFALEFKLNDISYEPHKEGSASTFCNILFILKIKRNLQFNFELSTKRDYATNPNPIISGFATIPFFKDLFTNDVSITKPLSIEVKSAEDIVTSYLKPYLLEIESNLKAASKQVSSTAATLAATVAGAPTSAAVSATVTDAPVSSVAAEAASAAAPASDALRAGMFASSGAPYDQVTMLDQFKSPSFVLCVRNDFCMGNATITETNISGDVKSTRDDVEMNFNAKQGIFFSEQNIGKTVKFRIVDDNYDTEDSQHVYEISIDELRKHRADIEKNCSDGVEFCATFLGDNSAKLAVTAK